MTGQTLVHAVQLVAKDIKDESENVTFHSDVLIGLPRMSNYATARLVKVNLGCSK